MSRCRCRGEDLDARDNVRTKPRGSEGIRLDCRGRRRRCRRSSATSAEPASSPRPRPRRVPRGANGRRSDGLERPTPTAPPSRRSPSAPGTSSSSPTKSGCRRALRRPSLWRAFAPASPAKTRPAGNGRPRGPRRLPVGDRAPRQPLPLGPAHLAAGPRHPKPRGRATALSPTT